MSAATTHLLPMLSVAETAQNLNVPTKTGRRLIARGEFPAHRVGSCLRISPDDVRSSLNRTRT
jgi:excisionase family DNA binding protein